MIIKPDGYTPYSDRKFCEDCYYCSNNFRSVPTQEKKYLCNIMEKPFEVGGEDVCNQFKKK